MIGVLENYTGELVFGSLPRSKDYLLLNVLYHRATKESNYKDYASLIFKNVTTGKKMLLTLEDPPYLMYVVKPEYRDYKHYPSYIELDRTYQKKVKFKNILKEIAKIGGKTTQDFYDSCVKNNRFGARKELHKYPYILATDYDYRNYFRCEWMLHYHDYDIRFNLTKLYADIEVDGIDVPGFPTPDICPINAMTIVDGESKIVYTFLLNNPNNPQIAEFVNDMEGFKKECHEAFDDSYGVFEYKIFLVDEEIVMLQQIFTLINQLERDFMLFWNMGFDIPYIINRIKALGYDPKDIMCDKDFVKDELYYRTDHRHHDFKTKNDVFTISSKTVYLDQMSQYIKIRKARSELKSVKLNSIARDELKDEKLDYSDEADIKTLPYKNYRKFVLYNIKDTMLQYGIEEKTHDIDNVFNRALINATQYESVFSQTILLKNRAYLSYYKQGYIIGNNQNIDYTKDRNEETEDDNEEGFEGALVGDPMLNARVGIEILGVKSKFIFSKVIDLDFSSMYPNIIISNNIGTIPMIGKVILDGFAHLNLDPTNNFYDQGKMFIEDYLSYDYSFIGKTYFNLPTAEEIIRGIEDGTI